MLKKKRNVPPGGEHVLVIYARGCPNCQGPISHVRLSRGYPCRRCLPEPQEDVCQGLRKQKRLLNMAPFCEVRDKEQGFTAFFEKAVGNPPTALQRSWIRRALMGESFAMTAQTGLGKTTFGLVYALYLPPPALFLFPTRLLAQEAAHRAEMLMQRAGVQRRILVFESGKKEVEERLKSGDYDLLFGTLQFFYRRFDDIKDQNFRLVFIDDVDAFLKSSRRVDMLFELLGFSRKVIQQALKGGDFKQPPPRSRDTQLIVSSATLRPRTNRLILFRVLLGFDIQGSVSSLRNVVDSYVEVSDEEALFEKTCEVIRTCGKGGLLYVSSLYGREGVEVLAERLRKEGFQVVSYLDQDYQALLKELKESDFDVAVGLAHIVNPLVRGIDMPQKFRYALFYEPPAFRIPMRLEVHPGQLYPLALLVFPLLEEGEREQLSRMIAFLRMHRFYPVEVLQQREDAWKELTRIRDVLAEILGRPGFIDRLKKETDVVIWDKEGEHYLLYGDAATYIQATGRISRFFNGKLTLGLSVVVTQYPKLLESLRKRLSLYFPNQEIVFDPFDTLNLDEILRQIDLDRAELPQVSPAELEATIKGNTTLVVVESPSKARTIASFFGKPQMRQLKGALLWEVMGERRVLILSASLGHVTDLVTRRGFFGVEVDLEEAQYRPYFDTIKRCEGEEAPRTYVDIEDARRMCRQGFRDKMELLQGLQRGAFEVDEVLVATDPDAEGEKIAFDLLLHMRPFNAEVQRIEFHEVTPRAFREALEQPREVLIPRVHAQLARRIADRWVGFTFSQILWEAFGRHWLSAGRVQTPVLGWIIERAEEARKKVYLVSFKLFGHSFSFRMARREEAENIRRALEEQGVEVTIEEEREVTQNPLPPFTTDAVLTEASNRFGWDVTFTMKLLQELFESGLITYHRTDSTFVSTMGRYVVAGEYIKEKYGESFFKPRSWGEEGTHEAIRPTRPVDADGLRLRMEAGFLSLEYPAEALRLYDLIFRRFIASQMIPARLREATLVLRVHEHVLREKIPVEVIDPGYLVLYQQVEVVSVREGRHRAEEVHMKQVPAAYPYTQGELVREMKVRGLGRPSTYAVIVDTLLRRKYVEVRHGRLYPTEMGIKVYTYLMENYPDFLREAFTRELEEEMDRIESEEVALYDFLERIRPQLEQLHAQLIEEEEQRSAFYEWEVQT